MKLKCKPLSPKLGREVPYPYYASSGAAAMDILMAFYFSMNEEGLS